jgi:endogenous inhibitor of DNA gyrase (YacG/DUF329 family)
MATKKEPRKCPECHAPLKRATQKAFPFTNPVVDYTLHAHNYRCPLCGYQTRTKGRKIKKNGGKK